MKLMRKPIRGFTELSVMHWGLNSRKCYEIQPRCRLGDHEKHFCFLKSPKRCSILSTRCQTSHWGSALSIKVNIIFLNVTFVIWFKYNLHCLIVYKFSVYAAVCIYLTAFQRHSFTVIYCGIFTVNYCKVTVKVMQLASGNLQPKLLQQKAE